MSVAKACETAQLTASSIGSVGFDFVIVGKGLGKLSNICAASWILPTI